MNRARRLPSPIRRAWLGREFDNLVRLQTQGRVSFGIGTYGVPNIELYRHDDTRLIVGSYTSIAKGVTFLLGGNHPMDRVSTYPLRIMSGLPGAGADGFPSSKGDLVVGSDVWIGHGALVVSGVSIGDGAGIGAGAVVTKDVPPFAVVAGNPARVVKFRHTPEQRSALSGIAWWEWPPSKVREATDLLASSDVDSFIRWARESKS